MHSLYYDFDSVGLKLLPAMMVTKVVVAAAEWALTMRMTTKIVVI